jgi:hypothetical protein
MLRRHAAKIGHVVIGGKKIAALGREESADAMRSIDY